MNSRVKKGRWDVAASVASTITNNPIREIVDRLHIEPHPDKPMIALSIGDPTIFGNLRPADEILEAVKETLGGCRFNGYAPTIGYQDSRVAVAEYSNFERDDGTTSNISPDDVIICSGCSHALDLCIGALASAGQNVLVPRPGFSIYKTLAEGQGIQIKYYNLLEHEQWEVDLDDLESKIDDKTVAIVIINPSNPCGSVYSAAHLKRIIDVADRNFVPIIADEIYEHLVFPGNSYVPLASLSENVPILSCSGITKRFLVPGWRIGWIVIHDKNNVFGPTVRTGLLNLSQKIIGSNTLVQGALPNILKNTPQDFFDDVISVIYMQAKLAYDLLKRAKGLKPKMPQGAMYMLVGLELDLFPRIKDDLEFVEKLIKEQSVFCLPGECFNYPKYIRIVLTVPDEVLREACRRITQFCEENALLDNHIENYKMESRNGNDIINIT